MRLRPRRCICPKPQELSNRNLAFIGVTCHRHGYVSYRREQLREIQEPIMSYLQNEIEAIDSELGERA